MSNLDKKHRTTLRSNDTPKRGILQRFGLFFIAVIFSATSLAGLFSSSVTAAMSEESPTVQSKSWAALNAVTRCLRDWASTNDAWNKNVISESDLNSGLWWLQNDVAWQARDAAASSFLIPEADAANGYAACNDIMKAAAKLWGYETDYKSFMCELIDPKRADGSPCVDGQGSFDRNETKSKWQEFHDNVVRTVYDTVTPALGKGVGFPLYWAALTDIDACNAKERTSTGSLPEDKFVYKDIVAVSETGQPSPAAIYIGVDKGKVVRVYTGDKLNGFSNFEMSCGDIADVVRDTAVDYENWFMDNPGKFDNPNPESVCAVANPPADCGPPATATSCGIQDVGWILCPIITFGAGIVDSMFTFIAQGFLETNITFLTTDSSNGTFVAWGIMRNIANVAFVIAFIIIVFSQLTGVEIANYGIKKLLPRLIISAILVNLSFFVCQLAVDLSNILGYGIKSVFEGVGASITGTSQAVSVSISPENDSTTGGAIWTNLAAIAIGAGGAAVVALNPAVLGALIGALLGAAVSILVTFFMLILRQMLIILMIVVAPLAFVAFLLPNTEKLFDQWRKLFTTLLLLFPIVGLIFGASALASNVLLQALEGSDDVLGQIIAAAVLMVPLILVPMVLKKSLDGVNGLGAAINNLGNKARTGLQGAVKNSDYMKYREQQRLDAKNRTANGTYAGSNPFRRVASRFNRGRNNNGVFNTVTGGYGAQKVLDGQAQTRKDAQEATAMFGGDDQLVQAWAQSGGSTKHAAYKKLSYAQQAQFRLLQGAGHHRKAASFFAAAQHLSESGKGDAASIEQALAHAGRVGANDSEIAGARSSAIAGFRKSGRGDQLAALATIENSLQKPPKGPMSAEEGWAQVAPSAVHRDGIDPANATGAAGRLSYFSFLRSAPENTRKALAGFDSMEARAQASARSLIIAAAQRHESVATGKVTITTIQEAKAYFGVT